MMSILLGFVLSRMPSRNPRKQHTVVCCIHGTFWLYFEIKKIAENRNHFSCMETFCSKKLCENGNDSVTLPITVIFDSAFRQKSLKMAIIVTVGDILFEKAQRKRQ